MPAKKKKFQLPSITPTVRDVEVEGVGLIRMRPLGMGELLEMQQGLAGDSVETLTTVVRALKMAIDAEPDEVEAWAMTGDADLVNRTFRALMRISGGAEVEEALGN